MHEIKIAVILCTEICFFFFSVARMAQTHISPYVREMESEGKIKDSVIKMLFENGVNKSLNIFHQISSFY